VGYAAQKPTKIPHPTKKGDFENTLAKSSLGRLTFLVSGFGTAGREKRRSTGIVPRLQGKNQNEVGPFGENLRHRGRVGGAGNPNTIGVPLRKNKKRRVKEKEEKGSSSGEDTNGTKETNKGKNESSI